MKRYEDMSDFEIDAIVTCIIFDCKGWEYSENGGDCSFYHCGIDGESYYEQPVLNYCNSASDAWPIIIDNEISMVSDGEGYYAIPPITHFAAGGTSGRFDFDSEYAVFGHETPRAAMICFLKMKDVENG